MAEKVIVNVEDLEKLQKDIDKDIDMLKRNKRADITTKDSKRTQEKYDFTEREKCISEYIKNNPGSTKQNVVNNFEGILSYSRGPIFNTIFQLEEEKIIIVRHDEHNRHVTRLFINNENILVSLIKDLNSFKQSFFNLIDKAMMIGGPKENDDWLGALLFRSELVRALLFPYKAFIIKYNLGDLLPSDTKIDDETLHKKFTIVSDTMREIHLKLYQNMSDKGWNDNGEELKEQLLSNFTSTEKSHYEELGDVLKIFEKYGLRQSAEAVFDSLFRSRDWLKLIPKFSRSDWQKQVVQFALHSLS
jgi:hypothetical protein